MIGEDDQAQEVPCIRCNIDFELNAIPQASATLAVGRDFTNVPSPVHDLAQNFVERVRARIYLTPWALGGRPDINSFMQAGDLGIPNQEVLIFDGFVTAAGFTRSRGNAQFTIQMEHWLSEMGFSSIFSKTTHPSNPGEWAFGALNSFGDTTGCYSTTTIGHRHFTVDNLGVDYWGSCLKPFFLEICQTDGFMSFEEPYKALEGEQLGKNDGAIAALNRFNSKYQQPLAIRMSINTDVAANIRDFSSAAIGTPGILAKQTLWDVLISTFSEQYLFWLVPRVEDAIIAPFTPGYREPYITIKADESTQIEWMRALGRPIRGVGMMADARSMAGFELPAEGSPPELRVGGYYTPPNAKGIIMMHKVPDWMTALFAPSLYGFDSTGASGTAIGNASQPGGTGTPLDIKDKTTKQLTEVIKPFLDKYAQCLYAIEKLKTRQAVCSGPFRLDIAPGSTVKVDGAGERFIPGDPLSAPFYAHVARVSIAVDGEQPMIGTAFHLSHIRSEAENGDDRTSVKEHPLYTETFKGAPLIDLPPK
jgi:hypothetical protein